MDKSIDPSAPAFPGKYADGMSLRDWFAGQALAGLYADSTMEVSCDTAASAAYKTADAMLAAREARNA